MRTPVLVTSIVIAGSLLSGCSKPAYVAAPVEVPVSVMIQCAGDSVVAKIKPLSVNIYEDGIRNEIAKWVLDPASTVTEIEIDKKKNGKWPYGGTLPYKVRKNEPGKGDGVLKDASGKYDYSITASCVANGAPRQIVIDPDMIIIRGDRPAPE